MRLATACLLLLSTTNTNNTPLVLVSGFQFNPLNHISARNTNTQNVGTPQISSTPQTTSQSTTTSTLTIANSALAANKQEDGESSSGFGKKKGRPKPPPRRSPTKDIKKAMAANDLVRYHMCVYLCELYLCIVELYVVFNVFMWVF